jgi:uncharacterized surface protein with fasciclin (FAS1) repeats
MDLVVEDEVLIDNLGFGETVSVDMLSGVYRPSITETDTPEQVILEGIALNLAEGSYNFLSIIGTVDDPEVLLVSIRSRAAEGFRSGQDVANFGRLTDEVESEQTLWDILTERDEFSILVEGIEATPPEIRERLATETDDPVTLLAPTNLAFENLLATISMSKGQFLSETSTLTDILRYHIVQGDIAAADFRESAGTSILTTLPQNQAFFVTVTNNGTILLNGFVQFEQVDIHATNGIIHVIDEVLLPQSALRYFGL